MRWSPQYWTAFAQKRITIQIDDMYFPVLHTCIELSAYVQQNLPAALWVFPSEWLPGLVSLPLQILLWAVIEGDLQQEHTWQEQKFMSNLAFAYSRPTLLKKQTRRREQTPPLLPSKSKSFSVNWGCPMLRDAGFVLLEDWDSRFWRNREVIHVLGIVIMKGMQDLEILWHGIREMSFKRTNIW